MRIGVGYSTLDIDMPPSKIDFQQWQKTRETDSLAADKNFVTNNCLNFRKSEHKQQISRHFAGKTRPCNAVLPHSFNRQLRWIY